MLFSDVSTLKLKDCYELDCLELPSSYWSLQQWLEIEHLDYYRLFTHYTEQKLDGFMLWHLNALDLFAHLLKIAVSTRLQGRGVGRHMLSEAEDNLGHLGIKKFYLEVAASNKRAIGLYTGQGYEQIRKIERFYKDGEDALVYFKEKHC